MDLALNSLQRLKCHKTVCINQMCLQIIYLIYMKKLDLALNDKQ